MVLIVAIFLSYSICIPSFGVIPWAVSLLSGTSRSFSGSRFPKAFSGGISTESFFLILSLGRVSSRAFSTQFSPTTTSFGSYMSPSLWSFCCFAVSSMVVSKVSPVSLTLLV